MTGVLDRLVRISITFAVLVTATALVPGAAAQQSSGDEPDRNERVAEDAIRDYEERREAIDSLVDLLASDDLRRLDFVATSMEQAMKRVRSVVEPLFAEAYSHTGDVEEARKRSEAVIRGFDDHSIRLASVGRTTGAVQIVSDADARLAGELLASAVRLIDRLKPRIGEEMAPRRIAQRIFAQTTIYETDSASPINQYLETVTALEQHTDEELVRYLASS